MSTIDPATPGAPPPRERLATTPVHRPGATGLAMFAGTIMVVLGVLSALAGISALLDDGLYVPVQGYLYSLDLTTWGWIHLILGVVVAAAGFGVRRAALGPCHRHSDSERELDCELPVPALLPVVVDTAHRTRRCRHLGPFGLPTAGGTQLRVSCSSDPPLFRPPLTDLRRATDECCAAPSCGARAVGAAGRTRSGRGGEPHRPRGRCPTGSVARCRPTRGSVDAG
ncbi:hypothetical protein GCM10010472_47870 [Pseudonocardia halophobica]|uniref:DUF7144 domain-containing protein n=1 Tax=Pseudonocardia halophobica TaxID=29401 RepID=A0A9W6NYL0_9PSEU|nr:hypothetical protein GCM10017577_47460 [Pseudonocardia halophobica]